MKCPIGGCGGVMRHGHHMDTVIAKTNRVKEKKNKMKKENMN